MTLPMFLERLTRVAPLGLRLWDSATLKFISDDLTVQAVPKLASGVYTGLPAQAFPNRSGVFVFNHLPGLQESEFGAGDPEYWASPPAQRDFIVSVSDPLLRFLPFSITVKAPTQKILNFACANGKPTPLLSTQPTGSVPLFSTPGRASPAGCAVIRALIARNPTDPTPAQWAVMEAYVKNTLIARGLADSTGQAALYFPYPKIVLPNPTSNRPPLTQMTWPVDIKIFSSLSPPGGDAPDLCEVFNQPAANPLKQLPNSKLQTQTLLYGQELIIQTKDKSELFLS